MTDDAKRTGRPSKYDKAFPEQARKLCLLGATDIEIADFFEVNVATLYRWKSAHPEFREALKEAKAEADRRVEESLYHRAVGYSHDAEKVFQFQGQIVRAPYREHYPPDTTAAIFWLKNRQPEQWRDKQEHEHTGKDGTPLVPVLNVRTYSADDQPRPASEAINGSGVKGH